MGRSRSARRALSGLVIDVFSTNPTKGWTVVRQVSVDYALQMLALKKWREIWYDVGDGKHELAGVQPLKPEEKKSLHQILVERLIAVTITLPEVKRNAGVYGRSHTIGMPEWRRLKRHARFDEHKILPPEDAIERAIEKVRLWPYPASVKRDAAGLAVVSAKGEPVFGDKAIRVYPPAPRKQAERK